MVRLRTVVLGWFVTAFLTVGFILAAGWDVASVSARQVGESLRKLANEPRILQGKPPFALRLGDSPRKAVNELKVSQGDGPRRDSAQGLDSNPASIGGYFATRPVQLASWIGAIAVAILTAGPGNTARTFSFASFTFLIALAAGWKISGRRKNLLPTVTLAAVLVLALVQSLGRLLSQRPSLE